MQLNIVGGQSFAAVTLAQNSTGFTSSMPFQFCNGYATAKVTVSAGSVTISQQCSYDNSNWFDPVDNTNTALGVVATSMGVNAAGRYVQYNPVLCNFMRYKIVEVNVAACTVGLTIGFQEGA